MHNQTINNIPALRRISTNSLYMFFSHARVMIKIHCGNIQPLINIPHRSHKADNTTVLTSRQCRLKIQYLFIRVKRLFLNHNLHN